MDIERRKITSRELNPRQRRKVRQAIRWYRERENYNGVTSIRFELYKYDDFDRLAWISLRTRRSDCGQYSPRAIVCERTMFAMIGPRGGLKIYRAEWGIGNSELTHVRKFL